MAWNEVVSEILGYFSICCWLVVFAPQIYENYKRKSGESVSLLFLYIWILGDLFGLIGALQQNLIATALILYAYYFVADAVLLSQVHYYRFVNRSHAQTADVDESSSLLPQARSPSPYAEQRHTTCHHSNRRHRCHCQCHLQHQAELLQESQVIESDEDNALTFTRVMSVVFPILSIVILVFLYIFATPRSSAPTLDAETASNNKKPVETNLQAQVFGYISAFLFLGARIPQIAKNYHKKSCEGLSIGMFIFSILGNVAFTLSILLYSLDNSYIVANIPWIIGSTGTLFFDLAIFYQFYLYHDYCDEECESIYSPSLEEE